MSDKVALSDALNRRKKGIFSPKGGWSCPFPSREETVRLARALKQQTGRPMARVIHEALEESLRRLSQAGTDPERRLAEMRAISRRVARLPDREHALGRGDHRLRRKWLAPADGHRYVGPHRHFSRRAGADRFDEAHWQGESSTLPADLPIRGPGWFSSPAATNAGQRPRSLAAQGWRRRPFSVDVDLVDFATQAWPRLRQRVVIPPG